MATWPHSLWRLGHIHYGDLATFTTATWPHSLWRLGHISLFKIQIKSVWGIESVPLLRQKGKRQTNSCEPEGQSSEFFSRPNCLESFEISKFCFNFYAKCGTMDEIHIVNDTKCDIPSSEIFIILL
jgi:hypothetical protein